MFDSLLDSSDSSDARLDARFNPVIPVPGPAPAAARRPQRGGVLQHSTTTKCKLRLTWARRNAKKQDRAIKVLSEGNFSKYSDHVAAVSFAHKRPEDHRIVSIAGGGTFTSINVRVQNRSHDLQIAKMYGCVGAIHGQASGLQAFIHNEHGSLQQSISVSTFDDTAMWMKDPASKRDRDAAIRSDGYRWKDGTLRRRGKTISLPVFNMTETVYTLRHHFPDSHGSNSDDLAKAIPIWRAALLHSPAQVLPKANTYTIINRRDRWTGMGVSGCAGSFFDPDSVVTPSPAWHTVVSTKDNLQLNNLILGRDESILLQRLQSGLDDNSSCVTLLGLSCCAHSVVLSTKIVTDRMDSMPSMFVKLGHLHESGRISSAFQSEIDSVVADNFKFEAVASMPSESAAWRAKAKFVLRSTRACMDLSEAQEDLILSIDNSDWDSPEWRHFCVGSACPCGCSEVEALKLMKMSAKLSVGRVESTPLAYRWKGIERFAAKLYRGRRQHDLYLQTHLKIFPKAKTRRSEEAIAALSQAQLMNMNNDQIRHKTNIRGGKVVEFMENDPNARMLEKLMVLNVGVQNYLNSCFHADQCVTALTELLQAVPNQSTAAPSAAVIDARSKAMHANLGIISGDAGRSLLSDYTRYLYFDSPDWAEWRLDSDEKFEVCKDMFIVMQDAFYRLIFSMDLPKLNILDVCRTSPDNDDATIIDAAKSIAAALRHKGNRCPDCIDAVFTIPWVSRLLDFGDATTKKAYESLCMICSLLRVASTLVEKKHLVGQEAKPSKRGVCIAADEVGGFVFRRLIRRAADQARDVATSSALGDAATKRGFQLALSDHLQRGHSDRRSEVASQSKDGSNPISKRARNLVNFDSRLKGVPLRGYDIFVRSNYHDGLEGDTTFGKRKSLDARWNALSYDEKQVYGRAAATENQENEKQKDENFKQFQARTQGSIESSRKQKTARFMSERLRAVQKTVSDILKHDVFQSGTALHDFDKGLKPSLIRVNSSQKGTIEEYKRSFNYDFRPVDNPQTMPSVFTPCGQAHGGRCGNHDDVVNQADMLTFNLAAKSNELQWKSQFPVILEFGTGNFVMLGRFVGNGKLGIFSKCVFVPRGTDHPWDCCDVDAGPHGGRHVPETSHHFFVNLLAGIVTPEPVEEVSLRRWNYIRESSARHFRARLVSVDPESECSLHCIKKLAYRKRKNPPATDDDDMLPFGLGRGEPEPAQQLDAKAKDSDMGSDSLGPESASDLDLDGDIESEAEAPIRADPGPPDQLDAAGDSDGAHSSDHDLAPEDWNCAGIKTFETAPALSRAKCCSCGTKIAAGTVRIDYRFVQSTSLGDQKRCHTNAECIKKLPVATRSRDVKIVKQWLREPLEPVVEASLRVVLDELSKAV